MMSKESSQECDGSPAESAKSFVKFPEVLSTCAVSAVLAGSSKTMCPEASDPEMVSGADKHGPKWNSPEA